MRRREQRRWAHRSHALGLSTAVVALLGSQVADAAEYPGDIAHKRRAHLDVESLYWVGSVTLPQTGADVQVRSHAFGVFGFRRVPIGFGLGYALSERVVLGARFDFSADPHDDDADVDVTIRASASPYLEVMFMRDQHVRPFFHVRAGVGGGRAFVRPPGERGLDSAGESIVYPTVGVGLGTHVFLSEEVSFDALLSFDHRWNYRRRSSERAGQVASADIVPGRWQLLDTTVSAAFLIGVSRWF